ncbi:uncharacterized protein LOC144026967 [Festucalex cinctus]
MERQQIGEQLPLNQVSQLGEAADIKPSAIKLRAHVRRAAVLIGALLLGAVVTAAVLLLFFYMQVHHQNAAAEISRGKVNVTCSIQKSVGQEGHHIYTVDRAATYLIYGWLAFSPDGLHAKEKVALIQTLNGKDIDIQSKHREPEDVLLFFFEKVKMVDHSIVSVHFSSQHIDSSFHIYEL